MSEDFNQNFSASDSEVDSETEVFTAASNRKSMKTVVSSDYENDQESEEEEEEGNYCDEFDYSESEEDSDSDYEAHSNKKSRKASAAKRKKVYYSEEEEDGEAEYRATKKQASKKPRKKPNSGIVSDEDLSEDSESDEEIKADKQKRKSIPTGLIEFSPETPVKLLDSLVDWNQERKEVLVKWKGLSHRWNTWCPLGSPEITINPHSRRKVENFLRKIEEEMTESEDGTSVTLETLRYNFEMNYRVIERIVDVTTSRDRGSFYLCKWKGLGYAESTWEWEGDVRSWEGQECLDSFLSRQYAANRSKAQRRREDHFAKLPVQPSYFAADLKLRDYQLDGLNWLLYSWTRHVNVILADEMGLGKTIQSVCFLKAQQEEYGFTGPSLIVVPLSTIDAWQLEFGRWAKGLNVIVYVGDAESRAVARNYEFGRFHVVLTTYELVLKDKEVLSQVKWRQLMVDEGHRLKNASSQLYEALYDLVPASGFRVLITGTPLQNSLGELWCLLRFLMPEKFSDYEEFLEKYNLSSVQGREDDCISDQDRLAELHSLIKPHILRRLKRDVEKSLPGKIERIIRVDLSPLQRQLYRHILTRNYRDLKRTQEAAGNRASGSLLNILGELKKVCNHPLLLGKGSPDADEGSLLKIQDSGKLELLQRLLERLKRDDHRVLIFSQSVKMLDILARFLQSEGYSYQRLDGSTASAARSHAITSFNASGSVDFCFLLSTRAGGLGINLATADTVIIYDSDWNPQNDLQAMARAHRIGQKRQVSIYRLVSANTIEEEILERAKKKMVLDHLVIQKLKKGQVVAGQGISGVNEFQAILKFGAQALFSNETPAVPASAIDLDALLAEDPILEDELIVGADEQDDDEFLGRFRIADLGTNPGAASWDEIIPEEERKRVEEEAAREEALEREVELQEALLTSATGRRTRKPEAATKPTKSKSSGVKSDLSASLNEIVIFPGGSEEDVSSFEGESKFGISTNEALRARLNEIITSWSAESGPLPSHFKIITGGLLQKASLPGLLERIRGLVQLRSNLAAFKSLEGASFADFSAFRHHLIGIKPPSNWSFAGGYSVQQDSALLAAVGLFGYGNWMQIKAELARLSQSWNELSSPQLVRRIDYLLKEMVNANKRKKTPTSRPPVSPKKTDEERERALIEKFRRPFKPVRNCFLELDALKQELSSDSQDTAHVGAVLTAHLKTLGDFITTLDLDSSTKKDAWNFVASFWPLLDRSSGPELAQMYAKLRQ